MQARAAAPAAATPILMPTPKHKWCQHPIRSWSQGEECTHQHDAEVKKQKNEAGEAARDQPLPYKGSQQRMGRLMHTKKRKKYPSASAEEIQEVEEEQKQLLGLLDVTDEDKKRSKRTSRSTLSSYCSPRASLYKDDAGRHWHGFRYVCRRGPGHTGNCSG